MKTREQKSKKIPTKRLLEFDLATIPIVEHGLKIGLDRESFLDLLGLSFDLQADDDFVSAGKLSPMVIVDFALEHEIDPEHLERMLLKKYPTVCGDDFENSVAEVIEESQTRCLQLPPTTQQLKGLIG